MTARQTTKSVPVGSFSWIANERALIQQHEEQDVEDFTFSARNDLEWLNEHMADIFERNQVDMAELLKTPGRLRGKTPKTARKQIHREPASNIFGGNQPPIIAKPVDNPFCNAIAQLSTKKELSPTRNPSKSPARSLKVLQDAEPETALDPVQDGAFNLSQLEDSETASLQASKLESQVSAGDSGIWSASSNFDSQQTQPSELPSQRMSLSSENFNFAPSGPDRDSTYRTAPEDSSDPPQPSPVQTKDIVLPPPPPQPKRCSLDPTDKSRPSERSDTIGVLPTKPRGFKPPTDKPIQQPIVKFAASPEEKISHTRRSGRLAERSSSPLPSTHLLSSGVNDIVPPSSPPNISHQEVIATNEEDGPTLPAARSPSPRPTTNAQTPTHSPAPVAESTPKMPAAQALERSPSRSSSEPPTPEAPVIRKSILNFAALPAREPLTNKKKSLGVKNTRESHIEQVRLNGASRASWMNRKGNGKSLGASSRQIEPIEKQNDGGNEEEQTVTPDLLLNRKRKSETVRDDSQKKSKGNTEDIEDTEDMEEEEVVVVVVEEEDVEEDMEEGSSGETAKAMALHNKTSTQRLQDRIQQLGKLNATREARSFPSSVSQNASLGHSELPQAEQTQTMSKRTKSDPQGQLPHNTNPSSRWTNHHDDEEEWIPMKQEPKRQLTRSNTDGKTEQKQKEIEGARPQSVDRWNNSPKQTIIPAPIAVHNMATSESAPMVSLKSPTYPPQRHLPGSPLKSSFSDDWIKAPTSPTRPPGEGAISAVKAHTSSVFKKAKEMLLKSSASSASAKIETMNPGLRSWPGGNNLRQQMVNASGPSDSRESLKEHEQQLYPDLGFAVEPDAEKPAPAEESTPYKELAERLVATEKVEPREGRQTRSSRSMDTRDVAPELEMSAPKVQKKSKAVERAEREEEKKKEAEKAEREASLRETQEKLRQAEEELRIAKEERRKEDELRQEQQRRQKEEQLRKEREESKRRQEERLRQEKEELKRRRQEELRRQEEEARNVENLQDDEDDGISDKEEESATESIRRRITSSAEPERPPSRLQKGGSRFQMAGEKNKPFRPGTADKNLQKPKPMPVSISVSSASQREMQSQRSKPNMAPSTSTLVAALKQSFENPGLQAGSSQISLASSSSANSLRASNPTGSKQLKSLTAAANQLKKEQEDKERKAAAKREIERRRLENQRKIEEEARRTRQKQAPTSTQKTLSRTQTVANLRQTSEEPERRLDLKTSISSKPTVTKTAVKRVFQPETTEDQQQYRQAPTKPGAPVYQQDGAKKRRTGEYDERPYEMAPPISQSVAKKEIMPKNIMPHGYAQAPAQASSSSSAMPSMLRLPTKPVAPIPQVEGVKFSKDKIRFANEATAGPSAGPPSAFKTPGAKSASKLAMLKTPAGAKDSPIYQPGENIDLPDIPTDSEDEDDNYAPKDNFSVPQWAESPELRALLRQQQTVNPEEVFGPMAKLDMDAIFQNRSDKQAHRFRARTSSANWSGADRLTAAEIAADHEARQKMIAQGGWKYQPPS